MPANHALDHVFMRKAIHAAALSIPDTERMNYSQLTRRSGFKESLLDGGMQARRFNKPTSAAD